MSSARVSSARDPQALRALREVFGHADYRGMQEDAVDAVLQGRDVLLTLPTGAGKSLAYQLPALLNPGLCLVISPLIALMQDQVDALVAKGIAGSFVNSTLSGKERTKRLKAAAAGELDLLYITPERFRSKVFQEYLPQLPVSFLAVDEAHCISEWGHDFRPDYSRLGEYRKQLGSPPTIALTATATPKVARDITRHLELRDPAILRAGIERPNLFLGATRVFDDEEKLEVLASRLEALEGAGIVYSALIRDLERLSDELARRGRRCFVYHGGLSANERREMQARFMDSDGDVVLATNAFGMGVDKANIRFVLHAQVPRTLESWTQEVGRAGRDGEASWCELIYLEDDLAIQERFIRWANPTLEYLVGVYETLRAWGERIQTKELDDLRAELLVKERHDGRVNISLRWLEVLGITSGSFETHNLRIVRELDPAELPEFVGSADKLRGDLTGLLGMAQFANADECRRVLLARHFELDEPEEPCGACDNCTDADAWRSGHFQGRPLSAGGERAAERGTAEYQRGDWVQVGRHVGQVVQVAGEGDRLTLIVESASDLRRRKVNPRRQRVRRVEP
ncbi:MAG: ATP-dependent DNA helicase RecQ [Planctomycetota bacterium]